MFCIVPREAASYVLLPLAGSLPSWDLVQDLELYCRLDTVYPAFVAPVVCRSQRSGAPSCRSCRAGQECGDSEPSRKHSALCTRLPHPHPLVLILLAKWQGFHFCRAYLLFPGALAQILCLGRGGGGTSQTTYCFVSVLTKGTPQLAEAALPCLPLCPS